MACTRPYNYDKQTEHVYFCETDQTYVGHHRKAHFVEDNNVNAVADNSKDRYHYDKVIEIQ